VIRVNGDRLWARIHALARIGATANGGCNRQALTDADFKARAQFVDWARQAGCAVRVDSIGNIFARRRGADDSLPALLTGSHLDTQPTGGKFDGIYGVLAGLEVVETLNDAGISTRYPVEVAVWCNEEGCRFPAAMMGSGVWASRMPVAQAYALCDRDGVSVADELRRRGIAPDGNVPRQPVRAAFEVHIEQGPVLERRARQIGIVLGVLGMSRHEIVIEGTATHAGPTPMADRRDPVRCLADVLPGLYGLADQCAPDARVTIGVIEASPGSPNTVPGQLRLTLDLRHPDAPRFAELRAAAQALVEGALARHALTGSMRCVWESAAVQFDAACVNAVRHAAQALGYSSHDLVSGAGHDSVNVARVASTAMIFIPCAAGLSHNEAESATQADVEAGANVLLQAMLRVDSADD
jgi:N-carbamoyl-L-amino-acid hydrolase